MVEFRLCLYDEHMARLLYNHTHTLLLLASMSSAPYQPLPSDDHDEEASPNRRRYTPEHIQLSQDPRFSPPTPAWWKRALVILFIISMFWLYFSLRASMQRGAEEDPQTIHALRCVYNEISVFFRVLVDGAYFRRRRYSKQHKYRPAASPIVYEKLKDGRTRVRGAAPSFRTL